MVIDLKHDKLMASLLQVINEVLTISFLFRSGKFPSLCNTQKVDLDPLQDEDYASLKHIIQDHFHYTQSTVAKILLDNWSEAVKLFIKVCVWSMIVDETLM